MTRPDFLTGAIDGHIHSGPDVTVRIGTSIDIARGAAESGMAAIVLKDHVWPSFTKAILTDQAVDGIDVYGGICLNTTAGGLSARSVRGAVAGGTKVIMFPTFDLPHTAHSEHPSRLQREHAFGERYHPTQILEEDGSLTDKAAAIVDVCAENPDVVLSNGHVPGTESVAIMERARERGVTRMVIEHPNGHPDWFTEDELRRLVGLGVKFNISYNPYNAVMQQRRFRECVEMIEFLGPENCALITDSGQPYNAWPYITFNLFCEMLYREGVSLSDIFTMAKQTPALLLGREPEGV